jgi:hypothetical protein
VLIGTGLASAVLCACGGKSVGAGTDPPGAASPTPLQRKITSAEESLGDHVEAREALRRKASAYRRAESCAVHGDEHCAGRERRLGKIEANVAQDLKGLSRLDLYPESIYEIALNDIEEEGLVGLGCHQDARDGWHC